MKKRDIAIIGISAVAVLLFLLANKGIEIPIIKPPKPAKGVEATISKVEIK